MGRIWRALFFGLLAWLCWLGAAGAQPSAVLVPAAEPVTAPIPAPIPVPVPQSPANVVQIAAPERSLAVPNTVGAFFLPLSQPLDPQAIWQQNQPITDLANARGLWCIYAGQRTVAKFTLTSQKELISTLELPLVRIDRVDLFWRVPGNAWKHAQAGDTVALSQWPIVSQHPTFLMHFDATPGVLDVLVVMQNNGFGETTALLSSDRESRERRLLQASVAGLLIGASAMVLLVSILLFAVYQTSASAQLLAYCATATVGTILLTGFGAIWFTPEWPQLNDAAKPLASTVASITMLMAALAALDRSAVGSKLRLAVWAMVALLSAYALAQVVVLPYAWRLAGGVATGVAVTVLGLWVSIFSWRRGDRFAPWVMLAVVLFALCAAVVSRGFAQVWGVDAFSVLMSVCLMASCLVLRHVLVLRERFGRAVIGRAATHRFRDPLTALLSYEGFEREVEQLAVRQQSGGGKSHILYFSLQALDNFKQEDGYVVWQRDLVRFAAVLQKVLGESWHIGRLTNSKFGAVCLEGRNKVKSEELLTMVLSNCARKIDTQGWIDRVGLRMVATGAALAGGAIEEILLALDKKLQDLPSGKRIAQG